MAYGSLICDISNATLTLAGQSSSITVANLWQTPVSIIPGFNYTAAQVSALATSAAASGVPAGTWNSPTAGTYNGNFSVGIGTGPMDNANSGNGGSYFMNTLVGFGAGNKLSTGNQNVAVGYKAAQASTGGTGIVAIGSQAATNITGITGSVVAIGCNAAANNTGSSNSVFIGTYSGAGDGTLSNPSAGAYFNVFIGNNSGQYITNGNRNVGIGGFGALVNNTTGSNNIAIGTNTAQSNIVGNSFIAIGNYALNQYNPPSAVNASTVAIGGGCLQKMSTGSNNTAIGYGSGMGPGGNTQTLIDTNCIFLGYSASRDGSISNNTALTNMTVIGASATGDLSNAVFLGNSAVTAAYIGGNSTTGRQVVANQGVSASTTNSVTNKIKVTLGSTTYYLLASTSAT